MWHFVFIKKRNYDQYTLALNRVKEEINRQERNEQLKSKKISNIVDIEIACNTLLLLDPLEYNREPLTYQEYITEIYQRPFIQIKPQWAFLNIIKSVKTNITAQEAVNANMTSNDSNNSNNPRKRGHNATNGRTNGRTKTSRKEGGMKTRNNRKYRKHRTRKRKNKKRRTHKK